MRYQDLQAGKSGGGFTLIELLTVIGIIGILASLMLPRFSLAKEHAKLSVCINNLRQIGIAAQVFAGDQNDRFPASLGGKEIAREYNCNLTEEERLKEPTRRDLFPLLKQSQVFKCPLDKGKDFRPAGPNFKPSLWEAFGCSYSINSAPGTLVRNSTLHPVDGGIGGCTSAWIPTPSLFIFVHEPPARPYDTLVNNPMGTIPGVPTGCWYPIPEWNYFHWHYSKGPYSVKTIRNDKQKFISPILFADGHSAKHDFTKALKDDPAHPFEPTKDWIWYKPAN